MITTTQLKYFSKSGARLYLKQELLNAPGFPFQPDEILKIEIRDDRLVISKPRWWEMLDWNQMHTVWRTLPPEIKQEISEAGLAPDNP